MCIRDRFQVDTSTNSSERPSSTNAGNYWSTDHFTPPTNGIYVMNYSIICNDSGSMFISKNSGSDQYQDIFGTNYYPTANNAVSTSYTAWTTASSSWYFSYVLNNSSMTVYKYHKSVASNIGTTKASILLIQSSS